MAKSKAKSQKSPLPKDVEIGQRIRAQRLNRSMSQTELADRLGVTFQQVQKYEKGVNRVGAGRLEQIAEALGVSRRFSSMALAIASARQTRKQSIPASDCFGAMARCGCSKPTML